MTESTPDPQASIWERGPQANWLPVGTGYNRPLPGLYAHLSSHVEAEADLLRDYSAAAQSSPSKTLSYLINLLIEDEVRHHRIFTELVESVKAKERLWEEGDWIEGDTVVPDIDFLKLDEADQNAVIALTERLIQKEREDEYELKRLQRELRDVKDTTLWSLLVDLMVRDTQKHIALLRFAKKHSTPRRH